MLSPVLATNTGADPLRSFLPVHVDLLKHIDLAPVDIFVQPSRNSAPTLYCRAGLSLDNHKLLGLDEVGIREVYVRMSDSRDFGTQLLESVESLSKQESIPATDRFAALQLAMAVEIEHTVRLIDCSKFVSLSQKVSRDIVSFISSKRLVPRDLFRIARHDFNTFVHVTNVASYSVILAQRLGISENTELEQIATAAMLHDIGKRFIPAGILNKRTRLDPSERELIETHPTRWYIDICDRTELTSGQLMIVYQHHERVDGSGYPVGVHGAEIHPWAKLVSVVDVFDAMTGRRSYRRAIAAQDALQYLMRNAGTQFDLEAARCWVSAMKNE